MQIGGQAMRVQPLAAVRLRCDPAKLSCEAVRVPPGRWSAMNLKTRYLVLCVLGVALPYWQFVPWVAEHGLNLPLLVQQLFANRIGGFFGMDVLVSAFTLMAFVGRESARLKIPKPWLPLVAVLTVGVSLALPLFLYMRERTLEQERMRSAAAAV